MVSVVSLTAITDQPPGADGSEPETTVGSDDASLPALTVPPPPSATAPAGHATTCAGESPAGRHIGGDTGDDRHLRRVEARSWLTWRPGWSDPSAERLDRGRRERGQRNRVSLDPPAGDESAAGRERAAGRGEKERNQRDDHSRITAGTVHSCLLPGRCRLAHPHERERTLGGCAKALSKGELAPPEAYSLGVELGLAGTSRAQPALQ